MVKIIMVSYQAIHGVLKIYLLYIGKVKLIYGTDSCLNSKGSGDRGNPGDAGSIQASDSLRRCPQTFRLIVRQP